ncbi:SpoIIE family protein phosphatase [Yinghuangia aomiensis]
MPPLGIVDPALFEIPVLTAPIRLGDRVLMFTDGIVEARDPQGAFYPLAERAPDALPGVRRPSTGSSTTSNGTSAGPSKTTRRCCCSCTRRRRARRRSRRRARPGPADFAEPAEPVE